MCNPLIGCYVQVLTLSCSSAALCEDIADLINGYCKLETGVQRDVWNYVSRESRRPSVILTSPHLRSQSGGSEQRLTDSTTRSRADYAEVLEDAEADYSAPLGKQPTGV